MRTGPALLRLDGIAGSPPGVEAARERMGVAPAVLEQHLRHTGAGALVGSGAVGDDGPTAGDLAQAALDLVRGHADRARQLGVGLGPGRRVARVEEDERLAA